MCHMFRFLGEDKKAEADEGMQNPLTSNEDGPREPARAGESGN